MADRVRRTAQLVVSVAIVGVVVWFVLRQFANLSDVTAVLCGLTTTQVAGCGPHHGALVAACTALRFNLSGAGADLRGAEISGALGFVSRADLDRQIKAASDGHLRLDAG